MSTAITIGSIGKHTSAYAQLRERVRLAEADNRQLVAAVEDRDIELHAALIRGCQDAMAIAQLQAERAALLKKNEELRGKTIRAQAEQERLRRAVVSARPRIREVPTDLVRPYSPMVCLPYVSPAPWRDTSNDATQQLPVIDRPDHPAA